MLCIRESKAVGTAVVISEYFGRSRPTGSQVCRGTTGESVGVPELFVVCRVFADHFKRKYAAAAAK